MKEAKKGIVLSMHPTIEGEKYCWDRSVWNQAFVDDIRNARAIILPQTVQRELYYFCRSQCAHVFPNYDIRFKWEGKVGDMMLFWANGVACPKTMVFPRLETLLGDEHEPIGHPRPELFPFPFVLKCSHGGEGRYIWLIKDETSLLEVLRKIERFEWEGIFGFIIQEYIPGLDRDLRVVVIGNKIKSYWRINDGFYHNLAYGARIEHDIDQELQKQGREMVRSLCAHTGINLAAFDIIFSGDGRQPLFLEINYYFGRRGLGGSEEFNRMLKHEITCWTAEIGKA